MIMAALGSRDPPRPPDPPSAGAGSRAGVTSIIINITLLTSINTPGNKSGHQTQVRQYRTYEYLHIIYQLLSSSCGCRVQTGSGDHIGFPPGYLPRTTALLTLHGVFSADAAAAHTNYLHIYKLSSYLQTYRHTIYNIYKHTDSTALGT